MTSTNVSKFVLSFLQERKCDKNIVSDWNSDSTQKQLKSSLPSEKRVKKTKDPDAPKKSTPAYLFFCVDERAVLKKEGSTLKPTEITSELGARWAVLKASDSKKDKARVTKYEHLAEEDKARYAREKKSYVQPEPSEEDAPVSKKTKKVKDPNAPKRGKSCYIFFCADERSSVKEDNPNFSATQITSELGVRWNTLKESTSKKDIARFNSYTTMAQTDKERYQSEKKSN